MNPLKGKLAQFLTEKAKKGLGAIGSSTPCAKALKKVDIDSVLREDIGQICNVVSFGEMTKIFSLAAQYRVASPEQKKVIKQDIKKIAEEIIGRVESKTGRLKIPKACRHLLFNL